jgi:hypothetical protein
MRQALTRRVTVRQSFAENKGKNNRGRASYAVRRRTESWVKFEPFLEPAAPCPQATR